MRIKALNLLLAAFLLTGIGCENEPYEEAEDISADAKNEIKTSIADQNERFMSSFQDADTARFAQVYTEDGWMMPPNTGPIKGREGIKQFLLQANEMGLNVELSSGELFIVSDSAAIETGSYKTFANGEEIDHGSFLVYWKKDGDTWRMHRDMWNSDMVPQNQQGSEDEEQQ